MHLQKEEAGKAMEMMISLKSYLKRIYWKTYRLKHVQHPIPEKKQVTLDWRGAKIQKITHRLHFFLWTTMCSPSTTVNKKRKESCSYIRIWKNPLSFNHLSDFLPSTLTVLLRSLTSWEWKSLMFAISCLADPHCFSCLLFIAPHCF